ncbi:MAG: glycosyl hydrolase-related protein [Lachnospiraceae bacterium]|nr:glycosyl hydrolase-related protein [Lachnospiraceae bacterium]
MTEVFRKAALTNLLEENERDIPLEDDGGQKELELVLKPYEIVTLRLA